MKSTNQLIGCCGLDKLCPVHNCVREKGLDTCADCGQMDGCPTLGRIAVRGKYEERKF